MAASHAITTEGHESSFTIELKEIERNMRSSFEILSSNNDQDDINNINNGGHVSDDERDLQWAAIERLPTYKRMRMSLFDQNNEDGKKVVDVTKLEPLQRHVFIDNLLEKIEEDNHRLLLKFKERIDKVGVELPTVEVRYKNLSVEAEYQAVKGRQIPTLWNVLKHSLGGLRNVVGFKPPAEKIQILRNVKGIIKPARITLLLGPPGCGKTTLLKALSGKLNKSLQVKGEITYNGYKFNEFVPQKTSAYISQHDDHISEMTVRETIDFSARCQGIGDRADILKEVIRREKQASIVPESDIDTYMKAISVEGLKRTLQTDYILKILGLDICSDTIVGDAMNRGISGGQKKRLTTGEMIVGPTKVLFMDEISNGLDTSTTFQIVTCLQHLAHITNVTILVSLLQPAPETFDLFDDVILMAEGKIVYHGPRENVLEFFDHCGFRCPRRKGIADFLQEVVSKKDQAQYWYRAEESYSYITVDEFAFHFEHFHVGQNLQEELSRPFEKSEYHRYALSFSLYSLKKWELFKACLAREWLLMKRNSFLHIFKTSQLLAIAAVAMTLFLRTRMGTGDMIHANLYMSALFYAVARLMANGIAELSLTVQRISVFYKQRDIYLYPAWAYAIPSIVLKIPFSIIDAFLWTFLTYYVIGFSPEPARLFYHFLILFIVHQVAISLFRLVASVVRNPSVAAISGLFSLMVMYFFGGFVIRKSSLPQWLSWAFWLSPMAYAEIGASLNEFLAPRWQKELSSQVTLGHETLNQRGLLFSKYMMWISLLALLGFWIVFNAGFTSALTFLKAAGRSQALICKNKSQLKKNDDASKNASEVKELSHSAISNTQRTRVDLPFKPVTISFESVQYFVDTPKMLRKQGFPNKKLQLLQDITSAFRPGVLTALMGVSGAGKTTLMDVLSGRKTGGLIEGEIRVNGYPKNQETYARVSAYCEQNDIHSPQITVEESLIYSAWLRLPVEVNKKTRMDFVADVLEMIELDEIKDTLVGIPGVSGISTEQRKRLTIAVELVSNPSIIFMDGPTTGLDARAAAVVMRVVKNIVNTNRTIVCTIHQPSIDVFEAFDELILMKRGGQVIYTGDLGQNSCKLIEYFENIRGVPKIKENHNPATWMLEVTGPSMEAQLGMDFAQLYTESHLYRETKELVKRLSVPIEDSEELHFPTRFPQNGWQQFKACLWKQHLSYWRSPKYNFGRLTFIIVSSLILGAILWQKGQKIEDQQDFFNIMGTIYFFMDFTGMCNCSSVLPFVATERTIVYRERFAGMYSSRAYSFAQMIVEIPYVFLEAVLFSLITYPAINFYWSAYKLFWYFYAMFCTLLFYNYFGLLLVSLTPTFQVAAIFASPCYTMMVLFSGYLIPEPQVPKWWVWMYWISPSSWFLKGILTSQYGNIEKPITAFGEKETIKSFLDSYFGYRYDDLHYIAVVILGFSVVCAITFVIAISKLNFQKM